jgi:hypothetical protein
MAVIVTILLLIYEFYIFDYKLVKQKINYMFYFQI